jgi:murein DD-endopeptidase MepM/ murein hydrolase activator NlpD
VSVELSEKLNGLYDNLVAREKLLQALPTIWPAQGWVSSGYGYRESPFTGVISMHDGLDIVASLGEPIYAPAKGIVSEVTELPGYGKTIYIQHGYGIETCYAHVKEVFVTKGKQVLRGDKIALVGNSGRSTGPHLHYEIRLKSVPKNPLNFILHEAE